MYECSFLKMYDENRKMSKVSKVETWHDQGALTEHCVKRGGRRADAKVKQARSPGTELQTQHPEYLTNLQKRCRNK